MIFCQIGENFAKSCHIACQKAIPKYIFDCVPFAYQIWSHCVSKGNAEVSFRLRTNSNSFDYFTKVNLLILARLESVSWASRSASARRKCCLDQSGSRKLSLAATDNRGPSLDADSAARHTSSPIPAGRRRTSGESRCSGTVLQGRKT